MLEPQVFASHTPVSPQRQREHGAGSLDAHKRWKDMKVLVTGASGRLGGFVIQELLHQDYEPVMFSRSEPQHGFRNVQWIQGDICQFDDCLKAMEGVEAVQHLAARPNPTDHPRARKSAHGFDATFKANMLGTYYMMQAAVTQGVQSVVMAGSNCALGHGFRISDTPFPVQYLPIDEKHPTFVEDTYSYSKLAGEEMLASYTRAYGIRTYVTRICGIFPPERRAELALNVRHAQAWSEGLWCWVSSEDAAIAHCMIMNAMDDLPEHDVYFVNADDTTALEKSMELVEAYRPDLVPVTNRLAGNQSLISAEKLKKAVGWSPGPSWRELR